MALEVRNLGLIDYDTAHDLQRSLQRELIGGAGSDTLLVCEHPPVITLGRSTATSHLTISRVELEARGFAVRDVERGGSVTYHGPGQAVLYPILDLRRYRKDVGWYMRSLEEVLIRTLNEFTIVGQRITGKTGVWVDSHDTLSKIAFIGVRISRWCTLHGLSLNVHDCTDGFGLIDPCGLGAIRVTSMSEILGYTVPLSDVSAALSTSFRDVFSPFEVSAHTGLACTASETGL